MDVSASGSQTFSDADQYLLDHADRFLADGLAIKRWYDEMDSTDGFADRFDLVHTLRRDERSRGFFGLVQLEGRAMPVMGVLDEVFYDRPKTSATHQKEAALEMRDQVREFVLHYLMRVCGFRLPQEYIEPEQINRKGMGFTLSFYKRKDTGEIGKFPEEGASSIIDLREIGTNYDWIIVKLKVYDFTVSMKPFGPESIGMDMPMKEEGYLILTPEFIANEDDPSPGVLGTYGFGYAFMKNPTRGMFAYGPGEFEAAFQYIYFDVLEDGRTKVRMAFVSDQPESIMNLTIDPVDLGFSMADMLSFGMTSRVLGSVKDSLHGISTKTPNLDPTLPSISLLNRVTNGQAEKKLDISRDQLFKGFLVKHSMQHYATILGSLRTWRQVPDWLDSNSIPDWVVKGESS